MNFVFKVFNEPQNELSDVVLPGDSDEASATNKRRFSTRSKDFEQIGCRVRMEDTLKLLQTVSPKNMTLELVSG